MSPIDRNIRDALVPELWEAVEAADVKKLRVVADFMDKLARDVDATADERTERAIVARYVRHIVAQLAQVFPSS